MTHRIGKIRAADLRKSKRLQRVYWFLRDGRWRSTREVQRDYPVGSGCCNAHTAKSELEANGCEIVCEQRGKYFYYRLVRGVDWEHEIMPQERWPTGMTAARRSVDQVDMFAGVA